MKRLVVPFLLLSALCLVPGGSAQSETPLLEDALGDMAGNEVAVLPRDPAYDAFDLVSLSAVESDEALHFTLGVAAMPDGSKPCMSGTIRVDFDHNGLLYRAEISSSEGIVDDDGAGASGDLYRYDDGAEDWLRVSTVPVERDAAAAVYTVDVLRDRLRDADGLTPQQGRPLRDFIATSEAVVCGGDIIIFDQRPPQATWTDQMPDNGPAGELPITLGLHQSGDGRITADRPMRASNGEAATFILNATAINSGDRAAEYSLRAEGVPPGWDVRFPVATFMVAGGERLDVPVVMSVPFAHQHGTEKTFIVQMTTAGDASALAQLEMGLYYLEVPQPSGHHPDLWFHAHAQEFTGPLSLVPSPFFQGRSWNTMNTLPDDPNDTGNSAGPTYATYGTVGVSGLEADRVRVNEARNGWFIGLSDGLQMGLDFDVTQDIELAFTIENGMPMQGATLETRLMYGARDPDWQRFAIAETTMPIDLAQQGETFDVLLQAKPAAAADLLAYKQQQALWVEIWFNGTLIGEPFLGSPTLQPGGTLHLPLDEYRDPVDDLFAAAPVQVSVPQEILINPGTTRAIPVDLHNSAAEGLDVRISVSGARADWASLDQERVALDAGGASQLTLTVTAPAGVADGDAADLVIEAYDAADPARRTLARVLVEVDTDSAHDALPVSTSEAASTPGILVVLAAALVAYRRRS